MQQQYVQAAQQIEYSAIEITVWDRDKNMAADMANHIALTIDSKNKEMLLRDKQVIIESFKRQVIQKNENIKVLKDSLEVLKAHASTPEDILIVKSKLENAIEDLNNNQKLLDQYQTSAQTDFSTIHVTEAAYPAIRKDKPQRSLIVAGAALATFIFIIILAVLTENYKKLKYQLKNA